MFTTSMTYSEIAREVRKDELEIDRLMESKKFEIHQKYRRKLLRLDRRRKKDHSFPHLEYITTSQNNKWLVIFKVYHKLVTYSTHCRIRDKHGYRFLTPSNDCVYVLNAHFFDRYEERYLQSIEAPTDKTWIQFFLKHPSFFYGNQELAPGIPTSEVYVILHEGFALCHLSDDGSCTIVKTFVDYGSLKKTQLSAAFNALYYLAFGIEMTKGDKSVEGRRIRRDQLELFGASFNELRNCFSKYGIDIYNRNEATSMLDQQMLKRFMDILSSLPIADGGNNHK